MISLSVRDLLHRARASGHQPRSSGLTPPTVCPRTVALLVEAVSDIIGRAGRRQGIHGAGGNPARVEQAAKALDPWRGGGGVVDVSR